MSTMQTADFFSNYFLSVLFGGKKISWYICNKVDKPQQI